MTYVLSKGSHNTFKDGCCAMELVAHLENLPHSHQPLCTSDVISRYVMVLNDSMPDDVRNAILLPVVLSGKLSGTSGLDPQRLAILAADRAVRVFAPLALDNCGLEVEAKRLRDLPPVTDVASAAAAYDAYDDDGDDDDNAVCLAAAYAATRAAADGAATRAAAYAAYASQLDGDWRHAIELLEDMIK